MPKTDISTAKEVLQNSGISEKATSVYLELLKAESLNIQAIVEATRIKRSTVYHAIEELLKRSMVTAHTIGKRNYYRAEPPENWLRGLERLLEQARDFLPLLNALQPSAEDKPGVRFFHGSEGIRSMYHDHLNVVLSLSREQQEILAITDADRLFRVWPSHYEDFIQKRIKAKVPIRILSGRGSWSKMLQERAPREHREIRTFDIGKYPSPIETVIYGPRVSFADLNKKTPVGVIVESGGIATSMRSVFEMLWSSLDVK